MTSCKDIGKKFRELDNYGTDVKLLFGKRGTEYKTTPGAISSVLVSLLVILISLSEIIKTVSFDQPNVQSEEFIFSAEEIGQVKLTQLNFIPMVFIKLPNKYSFEEFERVFDVGLYLTDDQDARKESRVASL